MFRSFDPKSRALDPTDAATKTYADLEKEDSPMSNDEHSALARWKTALQHPSLGPGDRQYIQDQIDLLTKANGCDRNSR